MIVKDEKMLAFFRGSGPCESCGKHCENLAPHHWKPRGMGGGSRLDIPINLISLGSDYDCPCHWRAQNNARFNNDLLVIIARREGRTAADIVSEINLRLRTHKDLRVTRDYP
jgi:hypothetical protein